MKTNRLLFLFLFLFSINTYAQSPEFKITSFTQQDNNLAARINKRLDDNDEACALIMVRTAETGLGFTASSGVVGNVDWKSGDYRLYVSAGNRSIKIFKKGIQTIDYVLPIVPKSSETYLLKLKVIRPKPRVAIWPVTIITTPVNANLTIDRKAVDNKTKTHKLQEGSHTIALQMQGYQVFKKTINVTENKVYFNFKLSKTQNAALMIESDPSGATVYLGGIKLGITPVSIFYPPGTYPVKVEKEGFLTLENENLTVISPQTRKKYTLEENVGFITVNTYEMAKVFVNGREYPEHKNMKFSPQVLNIKIVMPKAPDMEKTVILKRNDHLSLDLYPKVQTGTLQVAVTPFDATIELMDDAGEHYTVSGMHIFRNIPVGRYTLTIKSKGYATIEKQVTITENKTTTLRQTLPSAMEVKITSQPVGAKLYVDGQYKGITPLTLALSIEKHSFKLKKEKYNDFETSRTVTSTTGNFIFELKTTLPASFNSKAADIEMILVKGGTFRMGSPNKRAGLGNEYPQHTVTVNDFYIGKYEVTQKQWKEIMGYNPSYFKGDNLPVELVSWKDVQKFIKKLNEKTGQHYRLPTEAEWEYAARGGDKSKGYEYSGSNNIDEVAWYSENSGRKPHPVGTKAPNELGIYDMSGNVWEWCSDRYHANYYHHSPKNNPQGPSRGISRVVRGGSWIISADFCRVAGRRIGAFPVLKSRDSGFRIAR